MPRRRPPLGPLVTIITLRPNGVELQREAHAFATTLSIRQRANELRGEVRRERGWTPGFRVIVTRRDVTPFEDRDQTVMYLGGDA